MSKLVPQNHWFQGLFDFRSDFDRIIHRNLIAWPFSEAPPEAF